MLRVCLVSLPAAPVVDPTIRGNIGGTETRAWLFARTLAQLPDTEVHFVVRHREPLPRADYDGVHVHTLVDPLFNLYEQVGLCVERRRGFPWIRIKQWQWNLLWRLPRIALHRANRAQGGDYFAPDPFYRDILCDVFCTFGVQMNSAKVIAAAQQAGTPAVLVLGSDGDLDERFITQPDYVNPYGDRAHVCRWILQQATRIVCQTEEQQRLLKERFLRTAEVIANPLDLADWDRKAQAPVDLPVKVDRFVLWVGRAESEHKRPMECVEIARLTPDLPFVMVMNPRDPREEARVREAAPPNVTILTYVSPDVMPALMARALVLLNTSALEGFPNTFLQAGASRIPVVSMQVGDAFLSQSNGGAWTDGSREAASDVIREYAGNDALRTAAGERGRDWVERHHAARAQAQRLREILRQAIAGRDPECASSGPVAEELPADQF